MCLQFLWLLSSVSSLLAWALPTLDSVNSADSVNSQTTGAVNRMKSDNNWCSQQDTQRVEEPEAPLDGGSQWPTYSMWYHVAMILSVWALMGNWEVVDRSLDSMKGHYRPWVTICQMRRHGLPLAPRGGLPWLPWRWIWIVLSVMQHSVQCAETLGRTRIMYIGIRTRALWPWWTQHLWQQGSKWWKWWTLWDCGFLLGSEVHCAAESEASTVCGPGGHPQGAPSVRSQRIDHILRQSWSTW